MDSGTDRRHKGALLSELNLTLDCVHVTGGLGPEQLRLKSLGRLGVCIN